MLSELFDPAPLPSFQLPIALPAADPDAGDQVCIQFSKAWLPLVRGALLQLLSKATWDTTDPDALNTVQGQVFNLLDLFNDEAVCAMFDVRIDPENICMLQKTVDGGSTWQDVGSFYYCAKGAAADEIANEIADGILATRGQQPPTPAPQPGYCYNYHVAIPGTSRWLCPVSVSENDTVYVSNASGGWWDGDVTLGRWYCPTGKAYLLGICGADIPYYPGDPYQGGNHMQLVANIASTWADPLSAVWTVPGGIVDQPLYIQANDDPLSDNQGSVQFDVEVCRGGWTHIFNFLADNGGFTAAEYGGVVPTWVNGQGWVSAYSSSLDAQYAIIYRTLAADCHTLSVGGTVAGDRNFLNIPADEFCSIHLRDVGGNDLGYVQHAGNSAPDSFAGSLDYANVRTVRFELGTKWASMNGRITQLVVSGAGSDPFL